MTNRNPVKQLFITFPHSCVDKVQFRDDLLRFEPDYYKVVEEKHKDGTPHLHAVVRFKNKYSKTYVLKYFKERYPEDYKRIDVKPVRSIKNSIAYLSKEDENPLCSGEYSDNRNPKKNIYIQFARECGYDTVADCLKDFSDRRELCQRLRSFILENDTYDEEYLSEGQNAAKIYSTSYDQRKARERLFEDLPGNSVTKDDITLLIKQYKFKV